MLLLLAVTQLAFAQTGDAAEPAQIVRDFLAAFNAHDSRAMGELVTDEIQWLSVSAAAVTVEVEGKAALISAMDGYFQSCTTCQSKIAAMMVSGQRVSAVEIASWNGENGLQSQQSMSVYEFSGPLITRVYYYPSEPVADVQLSKAPSP